MNPITGLLRQFPALILDGALATALERRDHDLRDPPWLAKVLLEAPEPIRQVHLDYRKSSPWAQTAPRHILVLVRAIRFATGKSIAAYPNSGATYRADHRYWEETAACADFMAEAGRWYASDAGLTGGCCRAIPDHIAALAGWARHLPPSLSPVPVPSAH